jgi:hypothetical protein
MNSVSTTLVPGVSWPAYRPSNMTIVRERAKRRSRAKSGPTISSRIRDWVRRFPGSTGQQIADGMLLDVTTINRTLRTQIAYDKLRAEKKMSSVSNRMTYHYYPTEKGVAT